MEMVNPKGSMERGKPFKNLTKQVLSNKFFFKAKVKEQVVKLHYHLKKDQMRMET